MCDALPLTPPPRRTSTTADPPPPLTPPLPAGDVSVCDAATRTLWQLVKDNKRLLSPSKDALGLAGTQVWLLGDWGGRVFIGGGREARDKFGGAGGFCM